MLLLVFRSNFLSISQLLLFVNNFFIFLSNFLKFAAAVFSGELYNTKPPDKCQQFFPTFLFFRFYSFFPVFHCFSVCFLSVSLLWFSSPIPCSHKFLSRCPTLLFLFCRFFSIYRSSWWCTFSQTMLPLIVESIFPC